MRRFVDIIYNNTGTKNIPMHILINPSPSDDINILHIRGVP